MGGGLEKNAAPMRGEKGHMKEPSFVETPRVMDYISGLSREQMFEILEHIYNEVYVLDRDMNIIYVNPACYMNYGLKPEEMIGKNHNEFTGDIWFPSVVPSVYREKRKMCVEQIIYTGKRLVSCANPVLNADNEIEMVICLTEEKFEHLDIQYNPDENTLYDIKAREQEEDDFGEIVAVSEVMKALYKTAQRASQQDLPVLLQGESGTGKSMLAKFIHDSGNRRSGKYLAVNCATIPGTLLESELFGYKPHAFTGANPKGKDGLVRLADKGTLFLDEIAELDLHLQAKLLDVLENKTFIPVGGAEVEHADVRIIAATNKDLQEMVERKVFREDLYWRINVVDIKMPPLRNRVKDIAVLAGTFLGRINAKYATNKQFSNEVSDLFLRYEWPGNIRQFRNAIERAAIISENDIITVEDLPQTILQDMATEPDTACTYEEYKESSLKQIIQAAYAEHKTSRKVAEALGISHTTANRLLKKYT